MNSAYDLLKNKNSCLSTLVANHVKKGPLTRRQTRKEDLR